MTVRLNATELLEELVRIDSANTRMGGPGESAVAERVGEVLRSIGAEVSFGEVADGRSNVIGVLHGAAGARALLLEAHLDTVAQPRDGGSVRIEAGRLLGRGACDTKGSLASMLVAMERLATSGSAEDRPTVVFAGAIDEEVAMTGSRALVEQLPRVDGAVIGEPTSLVPVRVHNGLARFRIVARGRSAHSSRAQLGVNAIAAASRAVLAIQDRLVPRLAERAHPLAGPALATAGVIHGGVAANLVPDFCEIYVDRRLAPGEDPDAALAEIDGLLDELRANGDDIVRETPWLLLPAVDTPADHPLVGAAAESAGAVLGHAVEAGGVPYGTDASNLSGVGDIPCVVLGPGSIDQAHSDDEWVSLDEVEQAVDLYLEIVRRFGAGAGNP